MLEISGSYSSPNGHTGNVNIQASDTTAGIVLVAIVATVGVTIGYTVATARVSMRKWLEGK